MASRGRIALITVGLTISIVVLFLGTVWLLMTVMDEGSLPGGAKVAIVEVDGIIGVGPDRSADADSIVRTLGEYRDNPAVASLGAVAASGGYYVAVAANRIFANPGTLTGSIGVIMQLANVEGLLRKVGVEYVVVKAGAYKDIGSFARS